MSIQREAAQLSEAFSYRTWPFYWITRVSGLYRARMEQRLSGTRLDMPRWRVLMTLHQDRVASVSELAEHASTKLPTMTRIIQRMEVDGLVSRKARAANERIMEVVLTESGERAGDEAWVRADGLYSEAFAGFSDEDVDTLNGLLERVARNLGGVPAV